MEDENELKVVTELVAARARRAGLLEKNSTAKRRREPLP